MMHSFTLRPMLLLATLGAASLLGGCGRTLVFAESDGVNLAIKTNAASSTPIEVNFGLNRTVGTIVPPAGQKGSGNPDGEAVNMFAGFEIKNGPVDPAKPIDVDLTIDTQFASGQAAKNVASDPELAASIVNMRPVAISVSASAKELRAWVRPNGKFSRDRNAKLLAWLKKQYPGRKILPYDLYNYDDYEEERVAALNEMKKTDP